MQNQEITFLASKGQRRAARTYDWFIFLIIGILFYSIGRNESGHIHQLCGETWKLICFYVLIYCPLFDSLLKGTIGKQIVGIEVENAAYNSEISLRQSYKRVLYISWPMLLIALLLFLKSNGYEYYFTNYSPNINTLIFSTMDVCIL